MPASESKAILSYLELNSDMDKLQIDESFLQLFFIWLICMDKNNDVGNRFFIRISSQICELLGHGSWFSTLTFKKFKI